MTRRVLEQSGYKVLLANDGAEAVAMFTQHADEIRAVLTDIMMPQMDGVALIHVLHNMAPNVKVIMTTGIDDPALTATVSQLNVKAVLKKPFMSKLLLQTLRAVLDEPVVFALANPDPEIPYDVAVAARPDVIMCTGRSPAPSVRVVKRSQQWREL